MISNVVINEMQKAYGQMYEIENLLRLYIRKEMEKTFGPHWMHIAPRIVLKRPPSKSFENLQFYEYERVYFRTYPNVFMDIPNEVYIHLHILYPLRNKIAHCYELSDGELIQFTSAYDYIKSFLFKEIEGIK